MAGVVAFPLRSGDLGYGCGPGPLHPQQRDGGRLSPLAASHPSSLTACGDDHHCVIKKKIWSELALKAEARRGSSDVPQATGAISLLQVEVSSSLDVNEAGVTLVGMGILVGTWEWQ